MDNAAKNRCTRATEPGPHTWEDAAERVGAKLLEQPLRRWLSQSGLPGADEVKDDGSWSVQGRVQFLKVLCGEQV